MIWLRTWVGFDDISQQIQRMIMPSVVVVHPLLNPQSSSVHEVSANKIPNLPLSSNRKIPRYTEMGGNIFLVNPCNLVKWSPKTNRCFWPQTLWQIWDNSTSKQSQGKQIRSWKVCCWHIPNPHTLIKPSIFAASSLGCEVIFQVLPGVIMVGLKLLSLAANRNSECMCQKKQQPHMINMYLNIYDICT